MSSFYLDTSALLKRYLDESGTQWMNALLASSATDAFFSTSSVSIELIAAVARAQREKRLAQKRRDALVVQIAHESRTFLLLVAVTDRVITRAHELALRYPLRAYDALHLATAWIIREDGQTRGLEPPVFVSADLTLLAAAKLEGFEIANPNDHS